jgi:hypothetical protein
LLLLFLEEDEKEEERKWKERDGGRMENGSERLVACRVKEGARKALVKAMAEKLM